MSAPLISISAGAPVQDIAEALQAHRIKRLPVLEDGKLLGVVSRADLLCVVETIPRIRSEDPGAGLLSFLELLIGGASLRGGLDRAVPVKAQIERRSRAGRSSPPKPSAPTSGHSRRRASTARRRRGGTRNSNGGVRSRHRSTIMSAKICGESFSLTRSSPHRAASRS